MYVAQQVQCVREALLQMSSMYTDLAMRSDLPASTKGLKVYKYTNNSFWGYYIRAHYCSGKGSLTTTEKIADTLISQFFILWVPHILLLLWK